METATVRLLTLWKTAQGIESDYAAAQALAVSRSSPSNWRHGRSHAAAHTIKRMADEIGEEPGKWQALVEAERATKGEDRRAWASVARQFGAAATLAAVALATPFASHATPLKDTGVTSANASYVRRPWRTHRPRARREKRVFRDWPRLRA